MCVYRWVVRLTHWLFIYFRDKIKKITKKVFFFTEQGIGGKEKTQFAEF